VNDKLQRSRSPTSVTDLDPIYEGDGMFPDAMDVHLRKRGQVKVTRKGRKRAGAAVPHNSPVAEFQGTGEQVGKSLMQVMALANIHPFADTLK